MIARNQRRHRFCMTCSQPLFHCIWMAPGTPIRTQKHAIRVRNALEECIGVCAELLLRDAFQCRLYTTLRLGVILNSPIQCNVFEGYGIRLR